MEENLIIQQVKEYWTAKLSWLEDTGAIFPVSSLANDATLYTKAFAMPAELSALVNKVSREEVPSAFVIMLTGMYLSGISYANMRQIVVATSSFEEGQDVPLFLLPGSTEDMTVMQLLGQLQQQLYEAADHAPATAQTFLDILAKNEQADNDKICNTGFEYASFNRPLTAIKPAVHFRAVNEEGCFTIHAAAVPGVDAQLVERFVRHWFFILEKILVSPQLRLSELLLVHPEEEKELAVFSRTGEVFSSCSSINEFAEKQAAVRAAQNAVIYKNRSLSYKEVNEYADQLAAWLVQEKNILPGNRVGVLMRRSEWMVVVLLGILKSGAAYVPVDPAYPAHRVSYILNDSKPSIVLVEEGTGFYNPEQENVQSLDQLITRLQQRMFTPQPVSITPAQLAYIIYTSGSTGDPKGVMITHSNAVVFIEWALREFAATPFALTYAVTSYCFDLSVFEIFFTLAAGKTMRVLDSSLDIPLYVEEDRDILINTVPSVIAEFVHAGTPMHNVRAINMAGEPIPFFIKEALDCNGMEVRNLYGPSEDTTYSSYYRLQQHDTEISIGKPIANTDFYIMDDQLRLLPLGVPGEICISGDGLSAGYLFRPELTTQKFTDNPYKPGTKLYRTGDIGKWRTDGNMLYIGRKDHQVKIRGYRIELGEVETAISNCAGIKMALAVSRKDEEGKQYLAAYITGEAAEDTEAVRVALSAVLPSYMIPSFLVPLKEFPLTPNGKIDRKALPDPMLAAQEQVQYEAPASPLEASLAEIWQDMLMVPRIGVLDNFFKTGGDSLKATRIMYQVYKRLNLHVTLKQLFDHPTVRQLAVLLGGGAAAGYTEIGKAAEADLYPLSPTQKGIWILDQVNDGQLPAYNLCRTVYLDDIEPALLERSLQLLVKRHETLRTNIIIVNGEPWQKIHADGTIAFPFIFTDLRNEPGQEQVVSQLVSAEVLRPFRLDKESLIRATVLQLTDSRFLFIFNVHHIVSDGWSLELLSAELFGNYAMLKKHEAAERAPLALQYKDYVQWLYAQSGSVEIHRAYWMNRFSDKIPVLNFPTDRMRPLQKTFRGDTVHRLIESPLRDRMQQLANREEASLFMMLLAASNATLYRYTDQEDIVIGTPVAGRDHPDLEELIGLFAHALPVRTQFSGRDSFLSLLHKVKDAMLEAFEHQTYSTDKLADDLRLERISNRNVLFDVMIVLQNADITPHDGQAESGIGMQSYSVAGEVSQIDLLINFTEEAAGIRAEFQYNTDLYDRKRIEAFADHFNRILAVAVADHDLPVYSIPMLAGEELAAIQAFENNERQPLLPPVAANGSAQVWYASSEEAAASLQQLVSLFGELRTSVAPENIRWNVKEYAKALLEQQATIIDVTPSFLQLLLSGLEQDKELPPLQYTISAGEPLSAALAAAYYKMFPGSKLINAYVVNGYGLTAYENVAHAAGQPVTLGHPVPGMQVRIADKNLNPMAMGVTGEICTRKENGNDSWYCTGDLARWNSDGKLIYIGRRKAALGTGARSLDIAEIEHHLLACPGITAVRVLTREDKLHACYMGEPLPAEHIYAYLKELIPFTMLPAGYTYIANPPLTASGKLDEAKLYDHIVDEDITEAGNAPAWLYEKIEDIWKQVLHTDNIITSLNFFKNGGNSLSAIRMRTYIYRDLKMNIELDDIFANPTIHLLALFLNKKYPDIASSLEQAAAEEEVDYI